jgi:tetratricopeptide (TPR) repeat protein
MQFDLSQIADPDIRRLLADPANAEDMAKGYLMLGVEAENRNDWEDAVEYYQQVLSFDAKDPAVRYFALNNLACSFINLERFEEAEKQCIAAIEVDKDRHNAHRNLGLACEGQEKYSDAAVCFMNASFLDRQDKRAWQHLTQLLDSHPEVLSETEGLADAMQHARDYYEAQGDVPDSN